MLLQAVRPSFARLKSACTLDDLRASKNGPATEAKSGRDVSCPIVDSRDASSGAVSPRSFRCGPLEKRLFGRDDGGWDKPHVCEVEETSLHCKSGSRAPALERAPLGKLSGGFGEGVVEVVGMLAVGDVDGHFTGEAGQLAGA